MQTSDRDAWFQHWKRLGASDAEAALAVRATCGLTGFFLFNPGWPVDASRVEIVSNNLVRVYGASGQLVEERAGLMFGAMQAAIAQARRAFGLDPGRIVDLRGGKRADL